MSNRFIEKAYLYKCNFISDTENWEESYSYLFADSFEEAYELAKRLYDKENKCILDMCLIKHNNDGNIYGCYTFIDR